MKRTEWIILIVVVGLIAFMALKPKDKSMIDTKSIQQLTQ